MALQIYNLHWVFIMTNTHNQEFILKTFQKTQIILDFFSRPELTNWPITKI